MYDTYTGNRKIVTSTEEDPNKRNNKGNKERVPENPWQVLQKDHSIYFLQEKQSVC